MLLVSLWSMLEFVRGWRVDAPIPVMSENLLYPMRQALMGWRVVHWIHLDWKTESSFRVLWRMLVLEYPLHRFVAAQRVFRCRPYWFHPLSPAWFCRCLHPVVHPPLFLTLPMVDSAHQLWVSLLKMVCWVLLRMCLDLW